MHEWCIDRRDASRAPFEVQMQIYVPVNVVVCHPGACHQKLQTGDVGRELALTYILNWHTYQELYTWLEVMDHQLTIAIERRRWLNVR